MARNDPAYSRVAEAIEAIQKRQGVSKLQTVFCPRPSMPWAAQLLQWSTLDSKW
jgi:hypothetical protein